MAAVNLSPHFRQSAPSKLPGSKSNSRKRWELQEGGVAVRNIDIADSISYVSQPSSILQDTNLLINGLSKDHVSLQTSSGRSSNPHKRYKTAKIRGSNNKSKDSTLGDEADKNHPLMKDFLADLTNSENKR
jgi:hypothetical protein